VRDLELLHRGLHFQFELMLISCARYNILHITNEMEWVDAWDGVIPEGRIPVDGGYEETGERLYHAHDSVYPLYPGKTAPHIGTFLPAPIETLSIVWLIRHILYIYIQGGAECAWGRADVEKHMEYQLL
jgi:hypothetical protein